MALTEEYFTYAVVGGGIAGVSCVEQILMFDENASIVLISASPVVKEASNVIKLTKTLQDFIIVEKPLKSFQDVHCSVKVVEGSVTSLDSERHIVTTSTNESFKYNKLCICTGGRPKLIEEGNPHVVGLRDTETVKSFGEKLKNCKKIVIFGNGGIATELVQELSNIQIIWCVKDKSITAQFVDSGAAEFFLQAKGLDCNEKCITDSPDTSTRCAKNQPPLKRLKYTTSTSPKKNQSKANNEHEGAKDNENRGSALGPDWHLGYDLIGTERAKTVTIEYATQCVKIMKPYEITPELKSKLNAECEGREWAVYVELTNGKIYGCDLIVSATGVVVECPWFPGEVDSEKGILVNKNMESSVPDVFAAGDVCCPRWSWAKHWFLMKLWTQARHMGLYAGKCMFLSQSGQDESIDLDFSFDIFSHVTKFFGFRVVLLGLFNGQTLDPSTVHFLLRSTKNQEYIKVVMQDWKMQGAVLIGETGLEETFENLILDQLDLSSYGEDLLNPGIDIEDYFD